MKKLAVLIILVYPLFAPFRVFSQPVALASVSVEASGKSRYTAVLRYLSIAAGLEEGRIYPSREALMAAADEGRALLINTRYYRYVTCETVFADNPEGETSASLRYTLYDAWSYFPLPVLKYDSNYGLIYGGVLRLHNIGGSLTDMTAGFRYNPLVWYGWFEWEHIRLGGLLWDIWIFEQFETINRIDEDDVTLVDFDYLSTELKTRTDIPLSSRLTYTLSPGIRFPYSYRIRENDNSGLLDETGITPSFEHELSLGKVDWTGTRRSGYMAGLNHTLDYNIPLNRLRNVFTLEGQGFFNHGPFSVEGRILFFQSFGGSMELLGEYVRGLRDARLWGETALIVNFSAGMSLVDLEGVGEIQFQPFMDFALANRREPVLTIGLQILLFVDLLPALPNTLYVGTDVLHSGEWEYKMYSGLHYERKRFR